MPDLNNAAAAREQLASGAPALVWRRVVADTLTPVGAAQRLMESERGDFLLESVEGGENRGRYSLLGLAPDLVFRSNALRVAVNDRWASDRSAFRAIDRPPIEALRRLVAECHIAVPDGLPPALACLVGYFGYETIGFAEDIARAPSSDLDVPDMLFVRPTLLLVFDNLSDDLCVIAPLWPGAGEPEKALASASDRIDDALRTLDGPSARPATHTAADLPEPVLTPQVARADYHAMVAQAKEYIAAGDIFQVVLAQRFTCPFPLPPFALYRALRRVNPSPFLYFLDLPDFAVVGSSPEILVRVRDGEVTIRPIAGTRPRGATPDADRAAERELLADPKECAEHLMLLDLGRNDVGRVAAAHSVITTSSYGVERYSHVMHIVSNVVGTLSPENDALDALFAGFPAGTVSGAPKAARMRDHRRTGTGNARGLCRGRRLFRARRLGR